MVESHLQWQHPIFCMIYSYLLTFFADVTPFLLGVLTISTSFSAVVSAGCGIGGDCTHTEVRLEGCLSSTLHMFLSKHVNVFSCPACVRNDDKDQGRVATTGNTRSCRSLGTVTQTS